MHGRKSVERRSEFASMERIFEFCGLISGLKWIDVCDFFFYCILLLLWVRFKQVFFYFDWTCNFGKYFYEGENLSLYCKQIYEILLLIYWFFSDFFKTFVGLLDFLDFCKRVMILERFVIILMSFKSFHNSWFY